MSSGTLLSDPLRTQAYVHERTCRALRRARPRRSAAVATQGRVLRRPAVSALRSTRPDICCSKMQAGGVPPRRKEGKPPPETRLPVFAGLVSPPAREDPLVRNSPRPALPPALCGG